MAGKQRAPYYGRCSASSLLWQVVSELTEAYGELEESQRELAELDCGRATVDEARLGALQRGIQRFAALARFG